MIILDVEEYCQECLDFDPDVIPARKQLADWGGGYEQTNTQIQCAHRRRCKAIKEYLIRQAKETEEVVG